MLDYIRESDADLAQKIMDNMFTFDDLEKLDDKGIQTVLKEVQSESLIVALKGATAELREKIFKNMSTRAAETLREDLESRGPVRVSEVEAEQKEMLKIVRRLVDEGQIVMGGGGDDEYRLIAGGSSPLLALHPARGGRSLFRLVPRRVWRQQRRPARRPPRVSAARTSRPRTRPATRPATATGWWRSRVSSRPLRSRWRRNSAQLAVAFDEAFIALEGELAQSVARVATGLARQVVRSELAVRPDLVAQVATDAVNAVLLSARHIRVFVHPDDLALVRDGAGEALTARSAQLLADATLARGGCRIESDLGQIDARVEVRWEQAASALGQSLPLVDDVAAP